MDRYCKAPKVEELVGISNWLGEKLTAQTPLVDTEKGFYCAVTVPKRRYSEDTIDLN